MTTSKTPKTKTPKTCKAKAHEASPILAPLPPDTPPMPSSIVAHIVNMLTLKAAQRDERAVILIAEKEIIQHFPYGSFRTYIEAAKRTGKRGRPASPRLVTVSAKGTAARWTIPSVVFESKIPFCTKMIAVARMFDSGKAVVAGARKP